MTKATIRPPLFDDLKPSASLAIRTFFVDSPPPPLTAPPPSPLSFLALRYLESLTLKEVRERWDKEEGDKGYKGRQFVAEISTNVVAIEFYRRLHFDVVFDDPACRRVDVGWLGWEEKRTVKTCMRKRVRWF
ncbi:hypothetical protein TrRE_jg11771 [Triparma retinervis]|uniref:Uncharacterized protein n=1 Tax=Triparma retinervis TaxID=2557542 RepID=A0A9W7A1H8_9STRA|nr:hypothetical protein TrRE_jg11771 [Triparma retinervis]